MEQELKLGCINDFLFNGSSSREDFMQKVDEIRATSSYPHTECSDDCKQRGKPSLCVLHADWHLVCVAH